MLCGPAPGLRLPFVRGRPARCFRGMASQSGSQGRPTPVRVWRGQEEGVGGRAGWRTSPRAWAARSNARLDEIRTCCVSARRRENDDRLPVRLDERGDHLAHGRGRRTDRRGGRWHVASSRAWLPTRTMRLACGTRGSAGAGRALSSRIGRSIYRPGVRSPAWLKLKPKLTLTVTVTGGSSERITWGDWGEAVMLEFQVHAPTQRGRCGDPAVGVACQGARMRA